MATPTSSSNNSLIPPNPSSEDLDPNHGDSSPGDALDIEAAEFDFKPDSTVTLLVGLDQQKMLVHDHHICRNSSFFTSALKKEWTEGQARVIKLPEQCPKVMSHYLRFVYEAILPTSHFTVAPENTGLYTRFDTDDGFPLLATLYVYGERFLNRSIQHAVTVEIMRLARLTIERNYSRCFPKGKAVNIIYRGTTKNSTARLLMVEFQVRFGQAYHLKADCEQEFLFDVLQSLYWTGMVHVGRKGETPEDKMAAIEKHYS